MLAVIWANVIQIQQRHTNTQVGVHHRPIILGSKITYTPLKPTASSPLKIGWNAPKGKDCIPTIHFQGVKIRLVSGNVIRVNDAICYPGLWRTFLVAVRWDDLANLSIGTHQLELIPSLKPSVAPENRVSQKESSLPTIDFQGLW